MVFLEKMSKVLFGLPEAEIKQMTILTCWGMVTFHHHQPDGKHGDKLWVTSDKIKGHCGHSMVIWHNKDTLDN